MIVILCKTWQEALDTFDVFMQFLEENSLWSIQRVWEHCNCVETDEDLKYLFTHYRMAPKFNQADLVDVDQFLEDLDLYYEKQHL